MISNKVSDQSNMVSIIIRTNPGVVILSIAFMRRPETRAKPDV